MWQDSLLKKKNNAGWWLIPTSHAWFFASKVCVQRWGPLGLIDWFVKAHMMLTRYCHWQASVRLSNTQWRSQWVSSQAIKTAMCQNHSLIRRNIYVSAFPFPEQTWGNRGYYWADIRPMGQGLPRYHPDV